MTQEEEKYYDLYFGLFSTDGWKQFVEETKDILNSYRIEDIRDEKQLAYVKGERSSLLRIVNFEGGINNSYNMIKEREENAQAF